MVFCALFSVFNVDAGVCDRFGGADTGSSPEGTTPIDRFGGGGTG